MEIIAQKKLAVLPIYILSAALGLLLTFLELGSDFPVAAIVGVAVFIVSIGIIIDYSRIPLNVIMLDENGELHLPHGKIINVSEISDISYRRASSKGWQYKWGTVTITTYHRTFKYRYIAECETVAKRLTELMHGLN